MRGEVKVKVRVRKGTNQQKSRRKNQGTLALSGPSAGVVRPGRRTGPGLCALPRRRSPVLTPSVEHPRPPILGEWLKILGLVLAATIGLLLMQEMYAISVTFSPPRQAVDVIVYYAVRMPSFLTWCCRSRC